MIRIVHILNQFFAGIGGEDKADIPVAVADGAVGAARGLQAQLADQGQVVATIYFGDNYFHEHKDDAIAALLAELDKQHPDVVVAGPAFLLTQNFSAVRAYNPANTYALAIVHLGDRIRGDGPFVQAFPSGERILTLAEVQEVQRRLSSQGFDTGGTDGRVGRDTMAAVRNFQTKAGLDPADGYPGLKVLARLRQSG